MRVHKQQLLTLVLVAGMIVPAGSAFGASQLHSSADTTDVEPTPTKAHAGTGTPSDRNESNYTRLYVEDEYRHFELEPGENSSFAVNVANGEDDPVTVSPHVVVPEVRYRPVKDDWVSIETANTTLDPNEERSFAVTVTVPEDVDLGEYRGWIAFTDETRSSPDRPPRPIHAASVTVEVREEPTVRIVSRRHMYSQVEAGSNETHEIVVENTGDEPVPVSPELETEERDHPRRDEPSLQRAWFEIDAPTEIDPGENETVTVTISPPADTDRGRYETELDLGLTDPARPERNSDWQQLDLGVEVWKQPEEPFETTFDVPANVTNVTLKLSARSPRRQSERDGSNLGRFDVAFVAPNGTVVDGTRSRVTNRGHVDLSGDEPAATDGAYAVQRGEKTFRYHLDNPQSGTWTVRIMPKDTIGFRYEIVRTEGSVD